MKIFSLSSGSKGNATLLECDNFNILIDVGCSKKYLNQSLLEINKDINDIDMVLMTHFHSDHCKSINCFSNEIIFSTKEEHKKLLVNEDNKFIDISIKPFELSHDERCYGYQIKYQGLIYTHISDTGYLKNDYLKYIEESDYLYLEFNHDPIMLNKTNRPNFVKRRILSNKGHLNNQAAALALVKHSSKLKQVFIAHISEEANDAHIIEDEIKQVFNDYNKEITFDILFTGHEKLVIGGLNED
ncbi:MBL fold metallo-hydrolase [Erysipelotrichaceae bacterium OttesenSCG-928-M19]|nr:MBL fold metallo-hydrolase [Erysipelotrichaceae bacterium OttesenSCG-928-M19]